MPRFPATLPLLLLVTKQEARISTWGSFVGKEMEGGQNLGIQYYR